MSTIVTGLYDAPSKAAQAVRTLEAQGIDPDDISMVAGEGVDREAFGLESHSKALKGAATGAAGGGALGALVAGLTATGVVATGGAAILVAGPLVAALAGAGAGAAAGGALGGAIGAALPEYEVKYYEDALAKGSVLIGVKCDDAATRDEAKRALKSAGPIKIAGA
ncbi:MAG: hypothetical protein DIU71_10205 [Proteobacteria bacterium]|nr:MAG: hypothetical protein DIU71_10205 [Pseudomonadota bacterium]